MAALVGLPQELCPVDQLSACRGEVAVGGCLHAAIKLDPARILAAGDTPGVRPADGENPWVLPGVGYSSRRWDVRIAHQVPVGQRDGVEGMGAGADEEPVAGVGQAETKGMIRSSHRLDSAAIGLEAKVVSAELDLSLQAGAGHCCAAV